MTFFLRCCSVTQSSAAQFTLDKCGVITKDMKHYFPILKKMSASTKDIHDCATCTVHVQLQH